MRKSVLCLMSAALLLFGAATAFAQSAPASAADTAKGKALVDGKSMTLYIFDRDTAGMSNCSGQCAVNWPPFLAAAGDKGTGQWSVIARSDGGKQWAYKGKPLYTFGKDTKPGEANGDGVNSVWHIAAP